MTHFLKYLVLASLLWSSVAVSAEQPVEEFQTAAVIVSGSGSAIGAGGAYPIPLTLWLDFTQPSGTAIEAVTVIGPTLTFTRAGNAMSFDSAGNLAYAPHQLLSNAKWGTVSGGLPSAWGDPFVADGTGKTYEDKGAYIEVTFVASNNRIHLNRPTTVIAATTYTAGVYITSINISSGGDNFVRIADTNGTDGFIGASDFTTEGWYAVGFTMGAADTNVSINIGLGGVSNSTGTAVISRPFFVKGLLPGVGVNVPAKLSGEPLGRWIGTDAGDEPLYDQPRFAHDPANNNARLGLKMEEARTNDVLWNQDLTNAVWVKSNITVNQDATGLDGNANSASTITASAANGTVLQTVTKASAENTYSVWIKRKTGTGDIDITDDDGVNWTTLTGLSSSDWTRHDITRTQANPVFGIRIVTNTDAVEVDINQLEAGSFRTSEIPTTTASVTRAADAANTTDVSFFNPSAFTLLGRANIPVIDPTASQYLVEIDDGTLADRLYLYQTASASGVGGDTLISGGGNRVQMSDTAITAGTAFKAIIAITQDDAAFSLDGNAVKTSSSVDFPLNDTMTTLRIGAHAFGGELNGYIQGVRGWNVRKPNAFLVSETVTAANDNSPVMFADNDNFQWRLTGTW